MILEIRLIFLKIHYRVLNGDTKINPSPKALDFFKQQTNNLTKSINWGMVTTKLPENYENNKAVTEWGKFKCLLS